MERSVVQVFREKGKMNYTITKPVTFRINSYQIANPFIHGEVVVEVEGSDKHLYFPLMSPVPVIYQQNPEGASVFDVLKEWQELNIHRKD